MDTKQRLERARQAYVNKYQQRQYTISWRGGGDTEIFSGMAGFQSLCTVLALNPSTLNNYISRGHGVHTMRRLSPVTGEPDIATITRIDPPAKPKKPRGRPRTRFVTEEQHLPISSAGSSKIP
jgi:hypothetical protein